ncbi:hypothetical protein [Vreelandella boliviensis]|uniref:hypothetical protein n=1 Tax=Vreelandella boliviensis TaxID=223527 RepID=UPI001B8B0AA2|nr:hypothetical protein [Halomonas boliviensis]MBS3667108.1 hypothetical protein [Halomonas boliviensis]
MYAVEFETDIESEFIRLPQFEKLKNRHVKVIVLTADSDDDMPASEARVVTPQRRPAKVPPIRFNEDLFDTVPDSSWDFS